MEQDDAWNTKINSDIKLNYVCKTEVEYLTGQYYQPMMAFHIFISIALYIVQYALTFIIMQKKDAWDHLNSLGCSLFQCSDIILDNKVYC